MVDEKYLSQHLYNCTNKAELEEGLDLSSGDAISAMAKKFSNSTSFPSSEWRAVKMPDGHYAAIDEPIAELIITMNAMGFRTKFCCCGHQSEIIENGTTEFYIYSDYDSVLLGVFLNLAKKFGEVTDDSIKEFDKLERNEIYGKEFFIGKTDIKKRPWRITVPRKEVGHNYFESISIEDTKDVSFHGVTLRVRYNKNISVDFFDTVRDSLIKAIYDSLMELYTKITYKYVHKR